MNEYTINEIKVGDSVSFEKCIFADMEDSFREITGDINPLHLDDKFASENGRFRAHVVFGMLTASLYSTLAGVYLPGKYSLIHSIDDLQFREPVFVGDLLQITGKVIEKDENLGLIIIKAGIYNQDNKCVSKAKMKVLVLK